MGSVPPGRVGSGKMRGGAHSKDIRGYENTSAGLKIGNRLEEYQGLTTGIPVPLNPCSREARELPQDKADKDVGK